MINTTMNEQNSQDITPDEAAASLAFVTNLSQQMMPQAPMEQESAPTQEETPLRDKYAPQEETSESPELDGIKSEISALRGEIQEALKEEDSEPEMSKNEPKEDNLEDFKGEVKGFIESKFDDLTKALKDALK